MPYCKNCGNLMDNAAVVCVKCGFAKGDGASFCQSCGRPLAPGTPVCLSCGAGASAKPAVPEGYERRSKLAAGLLGIFLGYLGVHNFYLGRTGRAAAQLMLSVVGFAGYFIAFFFSLFAIAGMTGDMALAAAPFILIFSALSMIAVLASGLWGLIEGIMILSGSVKMDGRGVPLKD